MINPLVSIIVPVYGVELYLAKCIDSIILQTYTNIEVILVDDGSPDKCGEICDDYVSKDERVRVIHINNSGVNEARLIGFKNCNGDYVTFVDPDDYICPILVEHLIGIIDNNKVAMSCCQRIYKWKEKEILDSRVETGYYNRDQIDNMLNRNFLFDYKRKLSGLNLGLCCKMIERKYLEGAMESARGLWIGEDLISVLYIMYRIPSLYISQEYLYYYFQHENQSTRQIDTKTWKNQVEQWNRIAEIDKMGFLQNQLPYRILQFVKHFLRLNISNNVSLRTFVNYVNVTLESEIVREKLLNYHFRDLRLKDRLFVTLVKKHCYCSLYCLLRAIIILKKYN